MTSVSDTERSEWRGFAISGQGLRCEVEWGLAGAARSEGTGVDPVALAIDATDGIQTLAATTISGLEPIGSGTRGARADGALRVDLGRPDRDERRLVLVEEQGMYAWILPEAGANSVEIPVETAPGSRGLPGPLRRVLRIVGVETVGRVVRHASNTLVGGWDERRHPHRLRSWTPDDHRDPQAGAPDMEVLLGGPVLLVIHGFTGSIHGSFTFESDVVHAFYQAYAGRTLAFDHPTLAMSPLENAIWLGERLRKGMTLDVLAHSRGGLVARELAHLAKSRGVTVRSVTFVATPNDGTPLGDPDRPMGLVDALTNLVGALPGSDVLEMVLELLKDVVLRSTLEGLTGLVAMKPGGNYLTELNGRNVAGGPMLRSISADFEPFMGTGIVKTAQNRLMDAYFGGVRNDRIVPTLSTVVTSGLFRVPAGQRLILDSSRAVDHSTFWTNERVVRQLRAWLRPDWLEKPPVPVPEAETDPYAEVALPPDPKTIAALARAVNDLPAAARKAVEQLVGGPVNPRATPPTGKRPAAVVIPGIMGTHLRRRSDGQVVWIDPLRLSRGHFSDLMLPPAGPDAEIEPAGLNRTYVPLIAQLAAEKRDVYLAPFDWRADIRDSARHLAAMLRELLAADPSRSVHLVAHSMGGLVARALRVVARDVWDGLVDARRGNSGRLIMLGTPNGGSFAIPLILSGAETILKTLAFVDLRGDKEELLRVVTTFPGVYQMLPDTDPDDDQHAELYKATTWGALSPVAQPLLDDAQRFHDELREVVEPERMVFVAGYGHPTPFRLEVDTPGKFRIGRFSSGDGRVALSLGRLEKVTTYYSGASHGGLPSDPEVLNSIGELLDTGSTARLKGAEPERRGDPLAAPVMIAAEEFDLVTGGAGTRGDNAVGSDWRSADIRLGEALRLTLGGGTPRPPRATVEVRVLNANLEQASFPVAVGHYARLPQGGAELSLDRKLGGSLSARQRLGQYPELPNTALYVAAPKGHRPRGAIVLGLGAMGTVTPENLAAAMTQGVIAYVLDVREYANSTDTLPTLGVSAVLVGTPGRRGLSVDQCVGALVEGVVRAVQLLNEPGQTTRVEKMQLEIVELYDQVAEEAALAVDALPQMIAADRLRNVELVPNSRMIEGDGRLTGGQPRRLSGTPWVAVNARLAPPQTNGATSLQTMTFSALAQGAQANLIRHDLDMAQIKAYVDEAVKQVGGDTGVSRTLYELLFPHRAKLDLDRTDGLHLIVDEELAEIPWELLSAGDFNADVSPLALRAGMLRQLQSVFETRERSERPSGRMVLVVGDPPTGTLPRLPGAREEGVRVADLFAARGWDVVRRIYGAEDQPGRNWIQILDALNAHPYRVVHIAAHGIFDSGEDDCQRSGVVIGPQPHQRITALNFKQMTVTPDLVFLNCCHLGRMGSFLEHASSDTRQAYEQPHRVAANVARQLLRNGVGAVVVGGWAIDDMAAAAFSMSLYEQMLAGYPFGDAVFSARRAAHEADFGRTTTWGAYQCYGDPDFGLGLPDRPAAAQSCLVSPAQLAREFEARASHAGDAISIDAQKQISDAVDRLRDAAGPLLEDGRVLEALGRALSELGRYEEAIAAYQQAMRDPKGRAHLWVAEQVANLQVRVAVRQKRDGAPPAMVNGRFRSAATELRRLEDLGGPTAERYALRGSLLKKRATMRSARQRQKDLLAARDLYEEAVRILPNGYHTNLWLQMSALTSDTGGLDDDAKGRLYQHFRAVTKHEEDNPSSDYWQVAGVADTLITYSVANLKPDGIDDPLKEAEDRYLDAFRLRSTVRQRDSAIEHLEDLRRLVSPDRAEKYQQAVERLRKVSETALLRLR